MSGSDISSAKKERVAQIRRVHRQRYRTPTAKRSLRGFTRSGQSATEFSPLPACLHSPIITLGQKVGLLFWTRSWKLAFFISAAFPIKAEMSVAMPKQQAKEPIDLDIVLVCRKRSALNEARRWNGELWGITRQKASFQVVRLRKAGRKLSRNDVRVIVMVQLVRQLSRSDTRDAAMRSLEASRSEIESTINSLHDSKSAGVAEKLS